MVITMRSFLYLALVPFLLVNIEGQLLFSRELAIDGSVKWQGFQPVPDGGVTVKITVISGVHGVLYTSEDTDYPTESNYDAKYEFFTGTVRYIYFPGPARTLKLTAVNLARVQATVEIETYAGVYKACDFESCPNGKICKDLPNYEFQCVSSPGVTSKRTSKPTLTTKYATTRPNPPKSTKFATIPPKPEGKYNCANKNPCTPVNSSKNKFYFPAENPNKFVQCSQWGQCYVMPCPPGLVWNQIILGCSWS